MGYYMKLPFWLYPKHWGLKGFLYELARIEYDFDNKDTLIYIMAINDLKLKHHMMSETEHAHSLLNYKLKSGIITERRFLEELASLKESPEKEKELLHIKFKYDGLTKRQYDEALIELIQDEHERKIKTLDLLLEYQDINEYEYEKEIKTLNKEPYFHFNIDYVDWVS